MDNISVIMNDKKIIDSFQSGSSIFLFEKQGALWVTIKRIPVCINFSQDLFSLRKDIRKLIAELDDCKIIAGKTISGLAYQLFDKMGFDIFEIELFTPAILDQILSDVKNASSVKAEKIGPVETDVPGVYFLDLISLQNHNPEISSKMVLQSFLTDTPFLQLDIICGHLPPWIQSFISGKKMKLTTGKAFDDKIQVHIEKIYC